MHPYAAQSAHQNTAGYIHQVFATSAALLGRTKQQDGQYKPCAHVCCVPAVLCQQLLVLCTFWDWNGSGTKKISAPHAAYPTCIPLTDCTCALVWLFGPELALREQQPALPAAAAAVAAAAAGVQQSPVLAALVTKHPEEVLAVRASATEAGESEASAIQQLKALR